MKEAVETCPNVWLVHILKTICCCKHFTQKWFYFISPLTMQLENKTKPKTRSQKTDRNHPPGFAHQWEFCSKNADKET